VISEIPIRYDSRLIEEAVFLALRRHRESDRYHAERSRVYEIPDPERREDGFRELNLRWFERLGLGNPFGSALEEAPGLVPGVRQCVVVAAPTRQDEGAELFVDSEPAASDGCRRTVRILIRPESLLDPAFLQRFLRHELLHISDMLDSEFGYEPALPETSGGPTHRRVLTERYRVLWDDFVDGRMVRRGWAPPSVREERWQEFNRVFPMLGDKAAREFGRFFDEEGRKHRELAALAVDPGAGNGAHAGNRCPLCGFVTHSFADDPAGLAADVIAAIATDFPAWHPSHGLCLQCADLYRAREVSMRAASLLPGSSTPGAERKPSFSVDLPEKSCLLR
jgi:hypothetical protein